MVLVLKQKPSGDLVEWLKSTNVRIDGQSRAIGDRLDNTSKVINDLQKTLQNLINFYHPPN